MFGGDEGKDLRVLAGKVVDVQMRVRLRSFGRWCRLARRFIGEASFTFRGIHRMVCGMKGRGTHVVHDGREKRKELPGWF